MSEIVVIFVILWVVILLACVAAGMAWDGGEK